MHDNISYYGVPFVSKLRFLVIFMKPASIVKNIDRSLLNIDRYLLNTDRYLLNIYRPLLNIDRHLLNIDRPLPNIDRSLLNIDRHLLNIDRPLLNIDRYLAKDAFFINITEKNRSFDTNGTIHISERVD